MRKWMAGKLVDLGVRLDWDAAVERARVILLVDMSLGDTMMLSLGEPKRRGRPKGRKDGVGPKPKAKAQPQAAPKKRGRPLGSKNKPKETIQW